MRKPDDSPDGPPPAGPPTPQRSAPALNVPPATQASAAAILGVFLILKVLPETWTAPVADTLTLVPARLALALAGGDPLAVALQALTLLSYALLHFDWLHMLINLGFLLAFGSPLERLLGARGLILIFVLSAVAGAGLLLAVDWGAWSAVVGASGGVAGLMGGVIRLLIGGGDPRRRRLGLTLLLVFAGLEILFAVIGLGALGVDADSAWPAHLGGLLTGLLLVRPPRIDMRV